MHKIQALFTQFVILVVLSSSAFAMNAKDSVVAHTLEVWDHDNNVDQQNLVEAFKAYDIDPRFMTSDDPDAGFVQQEIRFIMRDFKQKGNTSPGRVERLHNYINDESLFLKLTAFFADVEKVVADNPTLSVSGASSARMQASLDALEKERQQQKLERERQEEEQTKETRKKLDEQAEEGRKEFEALNTKAIKKGYKAGACWGIESTIADISDGVNSLQSSKKCLVKADDADLNAFKVEGIVGKHVIYVSDRGMRFALIKELGKFYGDGGYLNDEYFKIVGSQQFKTLLGSVSELVVLKRVSFK